MDSTRRSARRGSTQPTRAESDRTASALPLTGGSHLSAPSFSPPLKPCRGVAAHARQRAPPRHLLLPRLDEKNRRAFLNPGRPFTLSLFLSLARNLLSSPRLLRRRRFKSGRLRPPAATWLGVGCSWSSGAAVEPCPGAPRRP